MKRVSAWIRLDLNAHIGRIDRFNQEAEFKIHLVNCYEGAHKAHYEPFDDNKQHLPGGQYGFYSNGHSGDTLMWKMDHPSTSRRTTKTPRKSELYSTVIIHDSGSESEPESESQPKPKQKAPRRQEHDDSIYATMFYKGGSDSLNDNNEQDDDEEDEDSLPPLLKRLPKDFGGGAPLDDDEEENDANFGGTMIVKTSRGRQRNQPWSSSSSMASSRKPRSSPFVDFSKRGAGGDESDGEDDDDGDGDAFETFVVKSTAGRSGGSAMGKAVASMQAVGDLGFGKQRKGSGSSSLQVDEAKQQSKVSSSSIPDSVTREDPTTKYELLNELGASTLSLTFKSVLFTQ